MGVCLSGFACIYANKVLSLSLSLSLFLSLGDRHKSSALWQPSWVLCPNAIPLTDLQPANWLTLSVLE